MLQGDGGGDAASGADASVPAARAIIALHIDPNGPTRGVQNATPANWASIVNFVAAADRHGFKLTLLMGADWPAVARAEPNGVERVAEWINNGHQLGFHHHSCGHTNPDGFRDVTGRDRCAGETERGSVRDAFAEVVALSESAVAAGADPMQAVVDTAAQGPNDGNAYRSVEWQPTARYATGPLHDNTDGHDDHRFLTVPRCTTDYGNSYGAEPVTYRVPELGHAQLDVGAFVELQSANNLEALEGEADLLISGDHQESEAVLGVVLHGREYSARGRDTGRDSLSTDQAYLDAMLQALADRRVSVVTAREILDEADPCSE